MGDSVIYCYKNGFLRGLAMPVSKKRGRPKTGNAKSNTERQREFRARAPEREAELAAQWRRELDHILDDVDIIPEQINGKWNITWDMSEETAAVIVGLYRLQGKDMTIHEILKEHMASFLAAGRKADKKLNILKADYAGG